MRNPCKECDFYHEENNTCQSKKCCTGGEGYVTWWDRLWCKPYKRPKGVVMTIELGMLCKGDKFILDGETYIAHSVEGGYVYCTNEKTKKVSRIYIDTMVEQRSE